MRAVANFSGRLILWQFMLGFGMKIFFVDSMVISEADTGKFTEENKNEILRMHNAYRSEANPPAADMRLMKWDTEAEKAALQWAKKCEFEHGLPPGYEPMGHNLYIGSEKTGVEATRLWWEETENYNFSTSQCGDICGEYTQVMWATSDHLGCGINACPKWNLIVCYYRPPGMYTGLKPYKTGVPCSQCDIENGGWCYQNMCVTKEECKLLRLKCECHLQCQNFGVLDEENCRCICKDGWDSLDCSKRCENSHSFCLKNPGFSSKESCHKDVRIKNVHCRAMCDQCKMVDLITEDNLKLVNAAEALPPSIYTTSSVDDRIGQLFSFVILFPFALFRI